MPVSVSPVDVRSLQGTQLPDLKARTIPTKEAVLHCFVEEGGKVLPGFRDVAKVVADPDPSRDLGLGALSVDSAAEFARGFEAARGANERYLWPDPGTFSASIGDASKFAYNSISGSRVQRFLDEASSKIETSGASASEKQAMRKSLNLAGDNMWSRLTKFDEADTGTYNSYSRHAETGELQNFAPVFEAMRDACPSGSMLAAKCQEVIDHIYTYFTAPKGTVDENNIEVSKEQPIIDRKTRARVSQGTDGAFFVLQVASGRNQGKFAYQLGNATVFDGTHAPVSAADHANLQRLPVEKVTFRPLKVGEQLRPRMQFDWNRNRQADIEAHKTDWFGFCNDQAKEEAIGADFAGFKADHVFRTDSEKTANYTRFDALGAQTALLNFGSVYTDGSERVESKSNTKFAGARYDDRPSVIQIGRQAVPVDIDSMTRVDSGAAKDIQMAFMRNIPDADSAKTIEIWDPKVGANVATQVFTKFHRNPEFMEAVSGDLNFIKGDTHVVRGRLKEDFGSAKKGTPFEFNPKTGTLSALRSGAPAGVILSAQAGQSVYVGREMQNGDATLAKREMRREAIRSGRPICTDRDNGMQVWNGKVQEMQERRVFLSEDGRFEVCENYINSKYGVDVGVVIYMRDEAGKVVDACEYKSASDFLWRTEDYVAPYIVADGGKKLWNQTLVERGMVQLGDSEEALASQTACVGMIERLTALVHRAASAKATEAPAGGAGRDDGAAAATGRQTRLEPSEQWIIEHKDTDGKLVRLAYKDKASWEADKGRLEGEAAIEREASVPARELSLAQRARRKIGCCSC